MRDVESSSDSAVS